MDFADNLICLGFYVTALLAVLLVGGVIECAVRYFFERRAARATRVWNCDLKRSR
jgi:hypothetical protein